MDKGIAAAVEKMVGSEGFDSTLRQNPEEGGVSK